jgi:ribosome-binding protein aMBF1 (putative translation factor)
MAKKFKDLAERTMSAESRNRAAARTKVMLAEMHLDELRRARDLSQQDLAERLGATQPEVSRIENRLDTYVSTLRRFIEAMGGELVIVARFPDGDMRINQFQELAGVSPTQR